MCSGIEHMSVIIPLFIQTLQESIATVFLSRRVHAKRSRSEVLV